MKAMEELIPHWVCFSVTYKIKVKNSFILFIYFTFTDQSVDSIYPYFLKHAHKVFPHLECIHELKKISDLTQPHNWYPTAREIHRKIFFHAGLIRSFFLHKNSVKDPLTVAKPTRHCKQWRKPRGGFIVARWGYWLTRCTCASTRMVS